MSTSSLRPSTLPLLPAHAVSLVLASAIGVLAFVWPLLIAPAPGRRASGDTTLLFALLVAMVLVVALTEVARGGLDARAVAVLGVLSAAGAALRPLGTGVAGFEPVFFLLVLAGRAFGPGFGFVLGATTLFASALITGGIGPWLPFQMLGAAWVGAGAGLLPGLRDRGERVLLAAYALVAGLAYGIALNLTFWPFVLTGPGEIAFVAGDAVLANLRRFVTFTLATSLGFDVPRAIVTAALVALTGRRVLVTLRRIARRVVIAPSGQEVGTLRG